METATRSFIEQVELIEKDKKIILNISKIFQWYKNDFGDIVEFISKYNDKVRTKISESGKKVALEYLPYNWKTNNK